MATNPRLKTGVFINNSLKKVDKYIINFDNFLGGGTSGKVYECIDSDSQRKYACKIVQRNQYIEDELIKLQKEAEMMLVSQGEYVTKLYFFDYSANNVYFMTELCNQGTLADYMKVNRNKLTENDIISIFYKIVMGYYESIYKSKVIHRDLKLENILIHDGIPKITDFGTSKKQSMDIQQTSNPVGTPAFSPPQGLVNRMLGQNYLQAAFKYTQKYDIFSLGIIFYVCFFGYSPGQPKIMSDIEKFFVRLYHEGTKIIEFPDTFPISEESKSAIRMMLEYEEKDRISIEDLLKHNVFSKIGFEIKEAQEKNQTDEFDITQSLKQSLIGITGANLVAMRLASRIQAQSSLQEVDKYFLFLRNQAAFYLMTLSNLFDSYLALQQYTGICIPQLDSLLLCLSKLQKMNLKHCNKLLKHLKSKNTKISDLPFNEEYVNSSMYTSTATKIQIETDRATKQFSDFMGKIELKMARMNEIAQMTKAIEEATETIRNISKNTAQVSDVREALLGVCKQHMFPQVKRLIENGISKELAESKTVFKVILALLVIAGDKIKIQQYQTFNFQQFYLQFSEPNIQIIERIKRLMEELHY